MIPSNQVVPTRYNGIRVTQAILGQPIPILYGARRLSAKLLWYGDFSSSVATNGGKKGGGSGGATKKGGAQYVYSASVIAGLCMGYVSALLSVWDSMGEFEVFSVTETFTVPGGGGSYTVAEASNFVADIGVGAQKTYSATVYDYGSNGAVTLNGSQSVPLVLVSGTPSTGEYSLSGGTYTFATGDAGTEMQIMYTAYRYRVIAEETTIVPSTAPYEVVVENQTYFDGDYGVFYYPSGVALTPVSGTPTATGTYSPNSGADAGKYLFAPGDVDAGITIKYAFKEPNTDANAPTQLGITLVSGAKSQSPWAYMSSVHPNEALGFTQFAYIAASRMYLGFVPELPNYSYEVVGREAFGGGVYDACPSDMIEDFLTAVDLNFAFPSEYLDDSLQGVTRAFWLANGFFISDVIEGRTTVAAKIGEWLEAGQVGTFWSDGVMKFAPYGTVSAVGNGATYTPPTIPIESLSDFDFIVEKNNDAPISVSSNDWQDAYNRVGIQWSVRTNNYNSDVTPETDDASVALVGRRNEGVKSYDFITTLTAATFAANMRLSRLQAVRNTMTFRLSHAHAYLEPMDVLELNDVLIGLVESGSRITKIVDDPEKGLEITVEEFVWASGNPSLYNKQAVEASGLPLPGQQTPGVTSLILIETPNPNSLVQGSVLSIFATGLQSTWGGCVLQKAVGVASFSISFVQISANVLTLTGTNHGLVNGDQTTLFDVDNASFLNGLTVTITSVGSTSLLAAFTHANYPNTADVGEAWKLTDFQPFEVVYQAARIGILGAVTNFALYSQQFSNGVWLKNGSGAAGPTVTDNVVTAPDGTTTAASLAFPSVPNSSGDASWLTQDVSILLATLGSDTYTYSIWLRVASGSSTLRLNITSADQNPLGSLNTGGQLITITSGWQRFQISATFVVDSASDIFPYLVSPQNSAAVTVYAWGAQLEKSVEAGTYVATTSAAVVSGALDAYGGSNPENIAFPVDLVNPGATLQSVSSQAASGVYPVTLCAIVTDEIPELLSYETATLEQGSIQPGSRYSLATLNRGLLGTAVAVHGKGDLFVRMDDASATYDYDPSLYGQTIFIAACSFNSVGSQQQSLEQAAIYKLQLRGTAYVGGAAAHLSYRPLTNPLEGHDTGSVPEAIVIAFSLRVPGVSPDIQINGGSITGIGTDYGQLRFIYYDDPALLGGNVVYQMTATKEIALEGLGRIFVGSIVLPKAGAPDTVGNDDGGTGVQTGMVNTYFFSSTSNAAPGGTTTGTTGTGSITNLSKMFDGDMTSSGSLSVIGNGTAGNTAFVAFSQPPALARRYTQAVLRVLYSVTQNNLSGGNPGSGGGIGYFYQGLAGINNLVSVPTGGGTVGITTASVVLPYGINLASVLVLAQCETIGIDTSGTYQINIYEVWIDVYE